MTVSSKSASSSVEGSNHIQYRYIIIDSENSREEIIIKARKFIGKIFYDIEEKKSYKIFDIVTSGCKQVPKGKYLFRYYDFDTWNDNVPDVSEFEVEDIEGFMSSKEYQFNFNTSENPSLINQNNHTNENYISETINLNSRYFPKNSNYNDNTNLLDIKPEDYGGVFVGNAQSISFIPSSFEALTRKVYADYGCRLVESPTVVNWKKYLLLGPILLNNSQGNNLKKKESYKINIAKIMEDKWDFKLGDFTRKAIQRENPDEKAIHKKVEKQLKAGEIGKAFKTLKADHTVVEITAETLNSLKSKFPMPCNHEISLEEIRLLNNFDINSLNDLTKLNITGEDIENILLKSSRTTAPGLDNLRAEHIVALWSPYKQAPHRERFQFSFTNIINKIAEGDVPSEIAPFFRDIALIALPKPNNDIRPIGLQLTLKKIAATALLRKKETKEFTNNHFGDLQYCMKPFGAEIIAIFFRTLLEEKPNWDFYAMDAQNGFNQVCRVVGLNETRKNFPQILPFLKFIYGKDSNAWFYGLSEGTEAIQSKEGCQQGDVMSMLFYALTIHPFLQKIHETLGKEGFTKWYADDGNISCSFEKMIQIVRLVKDEGPKYGYYIKFDKGSYLMAKRENRNLAIEHKQILVNLGIHENCIQLHPENDPDGSSSYIANVLGSLIGSEILIKDQLINKKLHKIRSESLCLENYHDTQARHLFLRWCISTKINHIQRSTPPSLIKEFVKEFDYVKRSIFQKLMNTQITDSTWQQACLPTCDSGLGYQNVFNISEPAFIAAVFKSLETLKEINPNILNSNTPMFNSFNSALMVHSQLSGLDNTIDLQSIELINSKIKRGETLQGKLVSIQTTKSKQDFLDNIQDPKQIAWITSLSDDDSKSARWLDVCPKSHHFKFSNDQFDTMLKFRMFLQQRTYIHGSKCSCKSAHLLDPLGHHIGMGCAKEGTFNILHDSVKLLFRELLSFSGTMVRLEEQGCFQEAFPDNSQRPDISLYNNFHDTKKVVCDISFAHPYPIVGSKTLTKKQALQCMRASNLTFQ